jgi:hypothetical protein
VQQCFHLGRCGSACSAERAINVKQHKDATASGCVDASKNGGSTQSTHPFPENPEGLGKVSAAKCLSEVRGWVVALFLLTRVFLPARLSTMAQKKVDQGELKESEVYKTISVGLGAFFSLSPFRSQKVAALEAGDARLPQLYQDGQALSGAACFAD